jgi:hypothetical protein
MRRLLFTAGILCLLLPVAIAEEPPDELFFRMEVGAEPGHFVGGKMIRTGEEWNEAALDLDGDGKYEKTFTFTPTETAGRTYTTRQVALEHDGATWVLDLTYSRPTIREDGANIHIRWTVTKGDFYAWFINGPVRIHTTPEAATEAKPIRMGPPFTFATGTRTRGMESLVQVGLKDENGCTMRLARAGKEERKIRIRLVTDGRDAQAEWATYG